MTTTRKTMARAAFALLLVGAALAAPSPAHAWWRGGFFIGFPPVYVGPPPAYYYPPPYYYAPPPPVVYEQPAPAAGQSCYAGAYVCPLNAPSPVGGPCSCPTNTGRTGGKVG
jgi:hypothetical protein